MLGRDSRSSCGDSSPSRRKVAILSPVAHSSCMLLSYTSSFIPQEDLVIDLAFITRTRRKDLRYEENGKRE